MARIIPQTPRPRFSAPIAHQPHFAGITAGQIVKWVPTLAIWGGAAGVAVTLYLSQIPLFKKDVLLKIPGVASYFKDTTPDSDKPF